MPPIRMVIHTATGAVLHDQIRLLPVDVRIDQTDDVGVIKQPKRFDLCAKAVVPLGVADAL
jgi:hypothetical protein